MEKLPDLSVIIPAYNEEASLEGVINEVLTECPKLASEFEIIIVNDGSYDRTREIAEELARKHACICAIHHPFNIGFGGAQKSGFLASRYDYITLIPSDGQFNIRDLEKYVDRIDSCDVVVGVRKRRKDPLRRKINTFIFRMVMLSLFRITLRDINWVKLLKKEVLSGIEIESRGICVDAELMFKAKMKGCTFKEVEVDYLPRQSGLAKGDRPLNVLITILELIAMRFKSWFKRGEIK